MKRIGKWHGKLLCPLHSQQDYGWPWEMSHIKIVSWHVSFKYLTFIVKLMAKRTFIICDFNKFVCDDLKYFNLIPTQKLLLHWFKNLVFWYIWMSVVLYNLTTYLLMVPDLPGHRTINLDSIKYRATFLTYIWKWELCILIPEASICPD